MTQSTSPPPDFPMPRPAPLTPPDGYAQTRANGGVCPVTLYDGRPAWLVSRYDLVRDVLADDRVSVDRSDERFPFSSPSRIAVEREATTFITMNEPEHTRLRRIFTRYFAVKRIQALRPMVEQEVAALLDELLAAGPPVDLLRAFALEVPARIICRFLGIAAEQRHFFQELDNRRNTLGTGPSDVSAATDELLAFVDGLVDEKRRAPDDGVISDLVANHLDQDLTRTELVRAVRLLITAGHETTANMIGLSTVALLTHPDQLAELRADPALVPNAVEELLRYISVFHISPTRLAVADLRLGDVDIHDGDGVIPTVAGANRDPDAFPDPDTLDIHREARHHVAFGFGPHQCLGQPLARLELTVVLTQLFARIPSLRLAVDPDDLALQDYAFLRLAELPVTWDEQENR